MSLPPAVARLEALFGQAGRPVAAMIEVADRCNEVCVHCYQVQGQKGEMDTAQVCAAIDQLADLGILFLIVSGGEATLRADFLDIVRHASARDLGMILMTNGLRMTRDLAQALGRLKVFSVEISLYSPRPEGHDAVTGVPGSWKKTVAAVRHLGEAGVHVVIKTPVGRFNEGELERYRSLVRDLGAELAFGLDRMHAREDGDPTPRAHDRSPEAALGLLRQHAAEVTSREERLRGRPCGACFRLHVEPNGEVRPCSQLGLPLGSALDEDGIRAAYQSEEARFLRSTRWQDLHGCRDCDLVAYCKRCYADARAEVGDALGPYAGACETARLQYQASEGHRPEIRPAAGRDGRLGPYRALGAHRFEPVPDVRTPEDDARARAHPWVRPEPTIPVSRLMRKAGSLVAPDSSTSG